MTIWMVIAAALVSTGAMFVIIRWLEAEGAVTAFQLQERPVRRR